MTVIDNIMNNLRRFFGMDESATPAEIDDRLEDYVAPAEQGSQAAEGEENEAPENRAEEIAPAQEDVQAILARLQQLQESNQQLQHQLNELRTKPLAAPTQYEEAPAETGSDPRERYICSITAQAMGRK